MILILIFIIFFHKLLKKIYLCTSGMPFSGTCIVQGLIFLKIFCPSSLDIQAGCCTFLRQVQNAIKYFSVFETKMEK